MNSSVSAIDIVIIMYLNAYELERHTDLDHDQQLSGAVQAGRSTRFTVDSSKAAQL